MSKPKSGNLPTTPSGIKATRLEDFKEIYEWQLEEYGDTSHKVVVTIPLKKYYELGVHCIENKISIANFVRSSIVSRLDYVNNPKFKEGVLF